MFATRAGYETRTGKRRERIALWTSTRTYQLGSCPAYCGKAESGGARIGYSNTGCISCLSADRPCQKNREKNRHHIHPSHPSPRHLLGGVVLIGCLGYGRAVLAV